MLWRKVFCLFSLAAQYCAARYSYLVAWRWLAMKACLAILLSREIRPVGDGEQRSAGGKREERRWDPQHAACMAGSWWLK